MNSSSGVIIGNYRLIRTLGEGTTGKVKLAQNIDTNELYAIKIIKKSNFATKPNLEMKINREIALMRIMDHPHILKLHQVLQSNRHIHMVLEYAPKGELFDYLVKAKSLREDVALDFFRQMIYALEYLHQHNICHRDLKPENILLDKYGHIKLADFGFARWMREKIADTSCGSPHYAAPEVIKGIPYNGAVADIWSAGVILFALLAGYLPFDDSSIRNLLAKVKRGRFTMPTDFPPDVKDLITRMMTVDPETRITIDEIKRHPAFGFGLPRIYQLPTPVPLPNLDEPFDIDAIPQAALETLEKIGIGIEEAEEGLMSRGTNISKIFVNMFLRRMLLAELPWSVASTELPMEPMPDGELDGFGDGLVVASGLRPEREMQQGPMSAADTSFSMAQSVMWLPSTPELVFEATEVYGPIGGKLAPMMAELQRGLVNAGLVFFHPDDVTILGKLGDDTFVRLRAEYVEEDQVTLTMHALGQTVLVQRIVSDLVDNLLVE